MSVIKNSLALVIGLITIGVVFGIVLTTNFNLDSKSIAIPNDQKVYTEATDEAVPDTPALTAGNFNPNAMFVDIVKKVRPSIVSIYTKKRVKLQRNPFYFFFRDFEGVPDDEYHQQPEMRQEGLGSGIIISTDGYIITNNHVVEDMDELNVRLVDNMEYEAKVIGTDPSTEIALVKIEAEGLPVAVLGNSESVQIGEWVMAIGSPLQLTSTVTAGIVSALHRSVNIIQNNNNVSSIENFIQTDAAINPGNSGGALVNLNGEVIGVNTAIATRTNYYMGYGFAVPINIAKKVVDDIQQFGEVRRGYLGVYIGEVDQVTARGVGLDKPRGVFITSVIAGSAADEAGIEEGDVILQVEGEEVNQPNELQAKVGVHNPGDEIKVLVWRNGKERTIRVKLQSQGSSDSSAGSKINKKEEKSIPNLGMRLQDLTREQKEELDMDGGVLVVRVDGYSAAAKARISRGDVIVELEKQPVKSVEDFYDRLSEFKEGDVVQLKLRRKQNRGLFDRLVFLEIKEP